VAHHDRDVTTTQGADVSRTPGRPVLFIHGLWLHATSWQPWIDLFAEAGYAPVAPGWPGEPATVEAARAEPEAVADQGIDDVTAHYAKIIAELPEPPIIIGHSFGGMVAEKLLGQNLGVAAIGIDAAQIKGVLPVPLSALRVTLPVFKNPANLHRSVMLDADQFRYGFGNALPKEESDALWEQWAVPSPGKPLFEAATANFTPHSPDAVDTHNDARGPLLLIMGGQDHTVPEAVTKSTLKQYRHSSAETDLQEFADRGHSLTVDHGWRDVATACQQWLAAHDL
jgi:pimeloyl-ACP methyl ester carboxylesterase